MQVFDKHTVIVLGNCLSTGPKDLSTVTEIYGYTGMKGHRDACEN